MSRWLLRQHLQKQGIAVVQLGPHPWRVCARQPCVSLPKWRADIKPLSRGSAPLLRRRVMMLLKLPLVPDAAQRRRRLHEWSAKCALPLTPLLQLRTSAVPASLPSARAAWRSSGHRQQRHRRQLLRLLRTLLYRALAPKRLRLLKNKSRRLALQRKAPNQRVPQRQWMQLLQRLAAAGRLSLRPSLMHGWPPLR